MNYQQKNIVIILGPTGIGKTKTGISLAKHFESVIISADSRQIYKEIPVGTAAPAIEEQKQVSHFLVGTHSIFDYYNAYEFEQEALNITYALFQKHDIIFMVGGSMMYIDAFCNSIDELPTVDPTLRESLMDKFKHDGLEAMRRQLKQLDPDFYKQVDLKNPKRIIHAIEMCLMTGQPYSSLRTKPKKIRDFNIIKIGLEIDRDILYNNINNRVLLMIENGLEQEAKALYQYQNLNALNTVGFKELFDFFAGKYSKEKAIELIQRNSRHYAKKQITWFKRDKNIKWFNPNNIDDIIDYINVHK